MGAVICPLNIELNEANLAKLHDYLAYGYRTNNGETMLQGVRELLRAVETE